MKYLLTDEYYKLPNLRLMKIKSDEIFTDKVSQYCEKASLLFRSIAWHCGSRMYLSLKYTYKEINNRKKTMGW